MQTKIKKHRNSQRSLFQICLYTDKLKTKLCVEQIKYEERKTIKHFHTIHHRPTGKIFLK